MNDTNPNKTNENKSENSGKMISVKNLVYLDIQKMLSISSQIFQGVTDHIISEYSSASDRIEKALGPVTSGQEGSNSILKSESVSEKRYLHDRLYVMFEEALEEQKRVLNVNDSTEISDLNSYSFVKVKGKMEIKDYETLKNLMAKFNERGEALAYITLGDKIPELLAQEKQKQQSKGKNQKTNIRNDRDIVKNYAIKNNLARYDDFHESLRLTCDYAYPGNSIEFEFSFDNAFFTSHIKSEALREPIDVLVKKYSRTTEKDFVLLGICTQTNMRESLPPIDVISNENVDNSDPHAFRRYLRKMTSMLSNVEDSISGKFPEEVVLDPIAVYTEL